MNYSESQMGLGDIFAKNSRAAGLWCLQNHCLDPIKKALLDCIAMAGCVLCAALLTWLLGR